MSVQLQLRRDTYANVNANKGAVGEIFVDTTTQRLVIQDGVTNGGFPSPVVLSAQNNGSTNDSSVGSGAFVTHNLSFVIPANLMIAKRVFRATAHLQLSTGTVVPFLTIRLLLGAVVLSSSAGQAMLASQSNVQVALQWLFQATQAPGASSGVQCAPLQNTNFGINTASVGLTPMPAIIATNAAQTLAIATQWGAAGTGSNLVGLNQLILEALN